MVEEARKLIDHLEPMAERLCDGHSLTGRTGERLGPMPLALLKPSHEMEPCKRPCARRVPPGWPLLADRTWHHADSRCQMCSSSYSARRTRQPSAAR